jgi:cystathionine gamma-lyase/cystathionine gamma-lyase/homocysteine desulfhydrase
MSETEKEEMGLGKNLIRLCFGLESIEDLKSDLVAALQHMERERHVQ